MKNKFIYLVLLIVSLLVYANSLNNQFISDDLLIMSDPKTPHPLASIQAPSDLSISLNYLVAKDNPFLYHLTSIILHSIACFLIFLFLKQFFTKTASFFGAILFCVHPIHTEAVSWIAGRPYIILAIFILSTYFSYNRAIKDC